MDKIEKIKEWVKKQKKEELARNSIGVITGKALFVDADELLAFLSTLSEEPNKSLEEAAEKSSVQYYKDAGYSPFPNVETAAHEAGFIAGAEWHKQQMLKDAVECELYWDGDFLAIDLNMMELGYSERDKVKVIVLKAEKK